jgi:hypothetical protein
MSARPETATQFSISRVALVAALAMLLVISVNYLVGNVPIIPPTPKLAPAEAQHAWPAAIGSAIAMLVADILLVIVILRNRRAVLDGETWRRVAASPGRFRLPQLIRLSVQQVPLRGLAISVLLSLGLLTGALWLGFPLWLAGVVFLLPWIPVYFPVVSWQYRHYGAYAIFAGITVLQLGHLAEHVVQNVQLAMTHGFALASRGVFGQLDTETVHFVWNVLIWIGTAYLLYKFGTWNKWLWISFAAASLHSIEHFFLYWSYVADHQFYLPAGILAKGGLIGSPLGRPYLHLVYNVVEIVPFVLAFWDQSKTVPVAAVHSAPARVGSGLVRPAVLTPVAVLAGIALTVGLTQWPQRPPAAAVAAVVCNNVTQQVGLDFNGDPGPVLAKDRLPRIMQENMGQGVAVGDYLNNGYLDVYVLAQNGHQSRLFRNDPGSSGGRVFTDVTATAGVGQTGLGRVAQFADLTNSGHKDLVVVNDYVPGTNTMPSKIFRNNGDGTFTDVTPGSGFAPVGFIVGGMALADTSGSGFLDIYISYWTYELGASPPDAQPKGKFAYHNLFYRNLGNYHFQDVTDEVGLGGVSVDAFTPVFARFTGHRLPDLYVAVDHRSDMFYENVNGHFREASLPHGVGHAGNNMGVAVGDVEGKGALDLFVTNIYDPVGNFGNVPRGNTLLMQNPGPSGRFKFVDQAVQRHVLDSGWGWGTSFVDAAGNGNMDIYAVQGFNQFVGLLSTPISENRAHLFMSNGHGGFQLASKTGCDVPGDQRSLVVFDFNRDGRPDFLITQVGGPLILLENDSPATNWLTVDLSRAPDNLAAGSRVIVTVGGKPTCQYILAGGSYLAGPPREAYFGLGSASRADTVRVEWSNGTASVFHSVAAGTVLQATP